MAPRTPSRRPVSAAVLAVTFLGMAAYEAAEMWMLEAPGSSPLALPIHALQVALILAATAVAFRAWRRKTAHEEALARLVERVLFAKDEERRRIAYELHDGISPLIVSAQQHLDTSRDLWAAPDPARARTQLDTGVTRLDLAIVEMRRVLSALQPSVVASRGLGPAARQSLEETATEAGWAVAFHEDLGDARLPAAVETRCSASCRRRSPTSAGTRARNAWKSSCSAVPTGSTSTCATTASGFRPARVAGAVASACSACRSAPISLAAPARSRTPRTGDAGAGEAAAIAGRRIAGGRIVTIRTPRSIAIAVVREGLRSMLTASAIDVVGEASTAAEAVRLEF